MAKKPKSGSKNKTKAAKAVSASVRKVAANKNQALSKLVKTKAGTPKPAKAKSVNSKHSSSTIHSPKSRVTPKPVAATKTKIPTSQPAIPSVLDYQEQRARIARRAYELYEERCPPNADLRDWLRAEREIMGRNE